MSTPNNTAVMPVPKVPGKNYYQQPSPSKRGFIKRELYLRTEDASLFDADAAAAGLSRAAFLRWLWHEYRRRKGLPVPTAERD